MKQQELPLRRKRVQLRPQRDPWMIITELVIDSFNSIVANVNGRDYKVSFFPCHVLPVRSGFYPIRRLDGQLALAWFDRTNGLWLDSSDGEPMLAGSFLYWAGLRDQEIGRQRRSLISHP